jgi:hypothetical protein
MKSKCKISAKEQCSLMHFIKLAVRIDHWILFVHDYCLTMDYVLMFIPLCL